MRVFNSLPHTLQNKMGGWMEEASGENHKLHVMRWGALPANGTNYQPNNKHHMQISATQNIDSLTYLMIPKQLGRNIWFNQGNICGVLRGIKSIQLPWSWNQVTWTCNLWMTSVKKMSNKWYLYTVNTYEDGWLKLHYLARSNVTNYLK